MQFENFVSQATPPWLTTKHDRRTLLRWKGKIQGHELESFDIIEENDEGLIIDRTIAFRPMPAAKLFRDAMRAAMGNSIPDDFWEYSN